MAQSFDDATSYSAHRLGDVSAAMDFFKRLAELELNHAQQLTRLVERARTEANRRVSSSKLGESKREEHSVAEVLNHAVEETAARAKRQEAHFFQVQQRVFGALSDSLPDLQVPSLNLP